MTSTAEITGAEKRLSSGPPPREDLIRATTELEVVREDGQPMPTLAGHFAVFNTWTEINSLFEGNFLERFAPGAFDKTIAENRDSMKVLFQHGQDPTIGNKVLGPIRSLKSDTVGTAYEVPLLDTTYNRDLIPGLDAGLYGASFRFRVLQENFDQKPKRSDSNPDGLPERTVTEAQVREFGPVTFPAYQSATAGLRSLTDEFLLGRFIEDPERLAELIEAYKARDARAFASYYTSNNAEPEPSEASTRTSPEPEPPAATTRTYSANALPARGVQAHQLPNGKERPSWELP